jgi:hypothetical protein
MNGGAVCGLIYDRVVVVRFEDINNEVTVHYENLNGETIA